MTDATFSALKQLIKCLDDASHCIDQVPRDPALDSIRSQLQSLKLILDHNRESLELRIRELPKARAAAES